jgi:hypothetical protein
MGKNVFSHFAPWWKKTELDRNSKGVDEYLTNNGLGGDVTFGPTDGWTDRRRTAKQYLPHFFLNLPWLVTRLLPVFQVVNKKISKILK